MWRNGWPDLKRPLDKGQGHLFWYQSISHMRLPVGTFAIWRTVQQQYIRYRRQTTTDGRNTVAQARPYLQYGQLKSYKIAIFADSDYARSRLKFQSGHWHTISILNAVTLYALYQFEYCTKIDKNHYCYIYNQMSRNCLLIEEVLFATQAAYNHYNEFY